VTRRASDQRSPPGLTRIRITRHVDSLMMDTSLIAHRSRDKSVKYLLAEKVKS